MLLETGFYMRSHSTHHTMILLMYGLRHKSVRHLKCNFIFKKKKDMIPSCATCMSIILLFSVSLKVILKQSLCCWLCNTVPK